MRNRKGNIVIYGLLMLIILFLFVTCTETVRNVMVGYRLDIDYYKTVQEEGLFHRYKNEAVEHLFKESVYEPYSITNDNITVTITPLVLHKAVPYEEKTNEEGKTDVVYIYPEEQQEWFVCHSVNTIKENKFLFQETGTYFLYADTSFSVENPKGEETGQSVLHGYLLTEQTFLQDGLGEYRFALEEDKPIQIIQIPEWNPYYFNALYEIKIENGAAGRSMRTILHKYDTNLVELLNTF